MSLSTDPFAAPSTRPQTIVLQRAEDPDPAHLHPAGPPRRTAVLAASVGTLALGAVAVGVAVTGSSEPGVPASLAPAAGAAMTLVPPAVGAPIVPPAVTPPAVTPPAVTTREAPVAGRTATGAPRRDRPRSVPAELREARELVAVLKERAREVRAEARERAADRRAHRHAPHGR